MSHLLSQGARSVKPGQGPDLFWRNPLGLPPAGISRPAAEDGPTPSAPGLRTWEAVAGAVAFALPLAILGAAAVWLGPAAANFGIDSPPIDYVTGIAWGAALLVPLVVAPFPQRHKRPLVLLWLVHLVIVLGVMLGYESYYGLDAVVYFRVGIADPNPLANIAFGQGTQNITALVGLASSIVGHSYHALKVVWAFVGFIATYVFYLAARLYLGRDDLRLLYILGLFPSIAFWSSILGKDPVTLLGLAVFAYGVVGLLKRGGAKYMAPMAAGLFIAAFIRVWLGAIFLAPFVVVMVLSSRIGPLRRIIVLLLAIPVFAFALLQFGDRFNIATADDLVLRTDDLSQNWARGGSGQKIEGGFQSIETMVAFMPVGVVTALFRPLPGEVLSPFGIVASAENALLIWLILGTLRRRRLARLRDPVLMWMVLTILAWASVYGFISYQNLGSAFRFKLQVMPLLLLLILALRTPLPMGTPAPSTLRRKPANALPHVVTAVHRVGASLS